MNNRLCQMDKKTLELVRNVSASCLTIYDSIKPGDSKLWFTNEQLRSALISGLQGVSLAGLPLRTRSKKVKQCICKSLGYPVPASFRKEQPRFPGQNLDCYVQKSNNLQIWNEELSLDRRYAIIRVSADDVIDAIRIISGAELALMDKTGTLTGKYQARLAVGDREAELVSLIDTTNVSAILPSRPRLSPESSPSNSPSRNELLPITELFKRLKPLLGISFQCAGSDQERLRGSELHRLACRALGYADYHDDGQFPDIKHQLLEIKLQTALTIDLGLVAPDSVEPLNVRQFDGTVMRHCDVRYAVFVGRLVSGVVELSNLILCTGEDFFGRFKQFGGKVVNRKRQIPLPENFYS